MTGIEAISNAVPAFEPVEWRNARITLSWMIGLIIGMFAGVLVITRLAGIVPVASQTMLSQLAHLSFGDGPVYVKRASRQWGADHLPRRPAWADHHKARSATACRPVPGT